MDKHQKMPRLPVMKSQPKHRRQSRPRLLQAGRPEAVKFGLYARTNVPPSAANSRMSHAAGQTTRTCLATPVRARSKAFRNLRTTASARQASRSIRARPQILCDQGFEVSSRLRALFIPFPARPARRQSVQSACDHSRQAPSARDQSIHRRFAVRSHRASDHRGPHDRSRRSSPRSEQREPRPTGSSGTRSRSVLTRPDISEIFPQNRSRPVSGAISSAATSIV